MENITKSFNSLVVVIATGLIYMLGGWDISIGVLVVFIVFDYVSGILKAIINKELSSAIGYQGIAKKVYIMVLVGVGYGVDRLIGNDTLIFRTMVCYFYIANEGISILENASVLDLPVPTQLKEKLSQLKGENEEELE
jgi:toxin secretion/phage lysis holin